MALVVGLGNPGERYARTRHNVAWRLVERLRRRWKAAPVEPPRGDAGSGVEGRGAPYRAWSAQRGGRTVVLMTPLTWMNLSGEALEAWRAEHPFAPEDLLVAVDDVYLPVGTLRIRARGSSGGHQGLESLERILGGRGYARLRIGVGEAESAAALREHVLEEFSEEEEEVVGEVIERAADAVECWLEDGLPAAMNRFNTRVRKEDSTS